MKRFLILTAILVLIFLFSCNNEAEKAPALNEFLIVTQEIIENYSEDSVSKETINYFYEKESDIFWKRAEYLDSKGKVYKNIVREFDSKRLPIKEIIDDGLGTKEIYIVEYSPSNYELLSQTEYEGEPIEAKKLRTISYKYDSAGYLISEESIKYSRDTSFINTDGNNIEEYKLIQPLLPTISRPKGNYLIGEDYTLLKLYLTSKMKEKIASDLPVGSLFFSIEQKLNDKNIPEYMKVIRAKTDKSPEPNLPEEEWYDIELDGLSNLYALTGYCKPTKDSSCEENIKRLYQYDDAGMLRIIEEYKYNPETKEYDMLHNTKEYYWKDPQIKSPHSYIDFSLKEERTCYHRKIYSAFSKVIEKYDSIEKVVIYSECSYPLDKKPKQPELKLKKKITYKLKKITIK